MSSSSSSPSRKPVTSSRRSMGSKEAQPSARSTSRSRRLPVTREDPKKKQTQLVEVNNNELRHVPTEPSTSLSSPRSHPNTDMDNLQLTEDESKPSNVTPARPPPSQGVSSFGQASASSGQPASTSSQGSSRPGSGKLPQEHVDDTSHPQRDVIPRRTHVLKVPERQDLNCTSSSDEGGDRPTSTDSSLAVDCPVGHTEVIVQGRNVRKIRVKFPQRQASTESLPRPPSGKRPQPPGMTRSTSEIFKHTAEPLALPQQETSLADTATSSRWQLAEQILPEDPVPGSREGSGHSRSLQVLQYDLSNLTQYGNTDMDQTYKNSVISGIEYFERKNWELKELNNRILRELDRVVKLNHELEDNIKKLSSNNQYLDSELEEMKIKLDQVEKENMRLQEQAVSQWESKVKAEEMFVERQRDAKQEVNQLKAELDEKNEEIKRLKSDKEMLKAKTKPDNSSLPNSKSKPSNANVSSSLSDNFELLHKIGRLEEDIQKGKSEREQLKDNNKRLKLDLEGVKSKSNHQSAELDTQYKRFLSLKKNFNDLLEENEKLKQRMRSRKGSDPNISNNTWPSKPRQHYTPDGDTVDGGVRLVDIPIKQSKQTISAFASSMPKVGSQSRRNLKAPNPHHQRNGSDPRSLPDSLPPVTASGFCS